MENTALDLGGIYTAGTNTSDTAGNILPEPYLTAPAIRYSGLGDLDRLIQFQAEQMAGMQVFPSPWMPRPETVSVEKPPKVDVEVPDVHLDEAVEALADEAVSVLGYSALSDKVNKVKGAAKLAEVLAKLEIQVLDTEKVNQYKAAKGQWNRVPIGQYVAPIPEHVIQKAVEIKKELPGVYFGIESLMANPDPFLVAVFNGAEFYIEVWDEPEFENEHLK